jgi:hypothetical protein
MNARPVAAAPEPLPLRTARRERAASPVGPRNGADWLLHQQGGTRVGCVLVEGKMDHMLGPSWISSPQRQHHRPKKHKYDEEGRERRQVVSPRHKGASIGCMASWSARIMGTLLGPQQKRAASN